MLRGKNVKYGSYSGKLFSVYQYLLSLLCFQGKCMGIACQELEEFDFCTPATNVDCTPRRAVRE